MKEEIKIDYFNCTSNDSMAGLSNAERLKLCSDLVYDNILITYKSYEKEKKDNIGNDFVKTGIYRKSNKRKELENKLKGYSNAYYLLLGYAFENIIKGLSIENNHTLSFDNVFKNCWKKHCFGHGIANIYKDNVDANNICKNEIELLERLEMYIIWLGKYPVAKKLEGYVNDIDNRFFDGGDKNLIDTLFEKIKILIFDKRRKRLLN